MNRATTARETLVIELFGDVSRLVDRVAALTPTLDEATVALTDAARNLGASVGPIEAHLNQVVVRAQTKAVEHIVHRTNAVAATSVQEQAQALSVAARKIFNDEAIPPLRRLAGELRQAVQQAHRPWDLWLTHAATATTSAFFAGALALYSQGSSVPVKPIASVAAQACAQAPARSDSSERPERARARK